MIVVDLHRDALSLEFAKKAAEAFKSEPRLYTYAAGDPAPGEPLAIRWNSFTVLVLLVDGDYDPRLYSTHSIGVGELPPRIGDPQPPTEPF